MRAELVREGEVEFAKPLPRALLRDSRLSWAARALFAFLWDLPVGWAPNSAHLAKMGPDGRDAVRARLAELKAVGALKIETILAAGGRLAGKRWILVEASKWAIEAPLCVASAPEPTLRAASTEGRLFLKPEKPSFGKAVTKVHQEQGSLPPPPPASANSSPVVVVVDGIDDLIEAAVWSEGLSSSIRNPGGLRRTIRARIVRQGGGNPDDIETLRIFKAHCETEARRAASEAERVASEKPPATPAVAVEGIRRAKAVFQQRALGDAEMP